MTGADRATGGDAADAATGEDALPADAYRILVVEDDRSQALFARGVLHGAGMRTHWVAEAAGVLPAIAAFDPELVLMDLHLPGTSGTELTAAIRAEPAHAHMPVVFLTGDPDPETEYRALDSGADDFLSKPIRPRHLVSAVLNRVRRARLAQAARRGDARDPATGLYRRDHVLAQLAQAPGALLVEVQGTGPLLERLGFAGLDTALRTAGARLAQLAPDAARLNDQAFLVLAATADDPALAALARRLREALAQPVDVDGTPLRLRVAVGHAALDAQAAPDPLRALETALRRARAEAGGVAGFRPQDAPPPRDRSEAESLRAALDGGRFELAFQPIVAVAGAEDAQFQALLRMRDGEGRLHVAADLVAGAAAGGLLDEVDRWVLQQALALLGREAGDARPARLFVSQSWQAIVADPEGAWLAAALERHGVEPGRLVIDLRLDDALVHGVALADFCTALVPHGVRFCLGRYVHGDEAAHLLRQLPLAYVRMAPEYSRQHADASLRGGLPELVHAAHAAGLRVIGSQVESPAAAAALWMGGIDYIQGNLVQGAGKALDFDFQHSVL